MDRISFTSHKQAESDAHLDNDECAVFDDSSSEWSDCTEDGGSSNTDTDLFQRDESKVNLPCRPSLITLMLAGNEGQKQLRYQPYRLPSGPSTPTLAASPSESDEIPLTIKCLRPSNHKPIVEVPRPKAQPIVIPVNGHAQAAMSPRSIRCAMLTTELNEFLRRHLLWERQEKTLTANAVLRRRHTSGDVAFPKHHLERPCLGGCEDADADSWNNHFHQNALDNYHSKGR